MRPSGGGQRGTEPADTLTTGTITPGTPMTTTAQNILELARTVFHLSAELDELRRRLDALDRRREGIDPEQLAEIVASRLAPQLDAARRAQRLAVRRASK